MAIKKYIYIITAMVAIALCLSRQGRLHASAKYPPRTGAVNDLAGLLSGQETDELTSLTGNLYIATGEDIAILTVKGPTRESVGAYCDGARREWKRGRGKALETTLLVFAPDNPPGEKVCVSADFDLNPEFTRERAGKIIAEKILPWADRGDYGRAVMAGALAVAQSRAKSHGLTIDDVMSRNASAASAKNNSKPPGPKQRKTPVSAYILAAAAAAVFAAGAYIVYAKRSGGLTISASRAKRWPGGHADAFGAGPGMFGGYNAL